MSSIGELPIAFVAMTRLSLTFRKEFAAEMTAESWAGELGAGPPMYGVLRAAAHRPGSSQRELAELLFIDASDLVDVLARMESIGWIVRERDGSDRRRVLVTLSGAGGEALARYDAVAQRVTRRLLSGLDDAEQLELARLCRKALLTDPRAELELPQDAG